MTYKILVVDDEPANLRLLDRLFSRDYYCLTASSGAEAIELLTQHDVAILITDQRMPIMTGLELLKQTAALRPHMVRILLTGYTDADALVEAINCGLVDLYLLKPWNNSELKDTVAQAVMQYQNNRRQNTLQVANERLQTQLKEMKYGFAYALAEALRYAGAHGEEIRVVIRNQNCLTAHRRTSWRRHCVGGTRQLRAGGAIDGRHQFAEVVGLLDEAVGAEQDGFALGPLRHVRGNDDDGNQPGDVVLLQLLQHRETIHIGQAQIQDDDIGNRRDGRRQAAAALVHGERVVADRLQSQHHCARDLAVVLDQENA